LSTDPRNINEKLLRLKGWLRIKKIVLIEEDNPGWDDLSLPWKI